MKRRWIIIGVVAWAVVIAGLGLYSSLRGRPTAREQTTIADALPTVDGALGRVYAALDPASSVAALGGYRRTEMSCRVTTAREGTRFVRELMVYVKQTTEPAVLDRIKAALPASYEAAVAHTGTTDLLTFDAGDFVSVRGGVTAPGQLKFTADTGCRPQDAAVTEPSPDGDRSSVQSVLDALGTPASQWRAHRLACPAGGELRTVEAVTTGDGAKARAAVPASAVVVLDEPKLFAYRAGPAGIALRPEGSSLVISATTGC